MTVKRILFVDDESHVLDGLRDLLRKQRKEWEMHFASSGQAALEALEKQPFDVVVSDMRMPGMDGATLLARVKQDYPATARIILSGQAERASVVQALPVAHQFLSKPCDAAVLRDVVERASELQKLLADEGIRVVIGKLDKLPSSPTTYWDLTRAAARPDVALADLASIVERDPAMATKVLQLVNSAYFGLAQKVASIPQAVSYLGTNLLKALALAVHAFGTMEHSTVEGFSLEGVQRHSLVTARLAKQFARDPKLASEAFTAGLVHEVGKIVLAVGVPERLSEVLRECAASGRHCHVVEREMLGVTHAEVGGYLLGVWGLPLAVVEAVTFHHRPGLVAGGSVETLAAVHIADALVHGPQLGASAPACHELDLDFVARAGLLEQLDSFRALAAQTLASSGK